MSKTSMSFRIRRMIKSSTFVKDKIASLLNLSRNPITTKKSQCICFKKLNLTTMSPGSKLPEGKP